MNAIYNYLTPKPISLTPLTQKEREEHFKDLSYMLIASVVVNIFFGIITRNPYVRALRFAIVYGSAFLFCVLDTQKKNSQKIDYRWIRVAYLHLSVSKAFLCLAQCYQYFFVYSSVDVVCIFKKGVQQAFKSKEFSRKIMSGVYALYYLRKSLKSGFEFKRLSVKC